MKKILLVLGWLLVIVMTFSFAGLVKMALQYGYTSTVIYTMVFQLALISFGVFLINKSKK